MRRLPYLAGATVLFAVPAFAGDVPASAPAPQASMPRAPAPQPPSSQAPPPASAPQVFSWAGFHVGAYAGYGWGSAGTDGTLDPNSGFGNSVPSAQPAYNAAMSASLKTQGFTGGGTAGADWQKGRLVLGVEGDFGAFVFSKAASTSVMVPNRTSLTSGTTISADWLATMRSRAGFIFDHWLIYLTGGLAFTDISFRQTNTYAIDLPGGIENFSAMNTRAGWVAGAGIEYALDQDWSAKAEYLHLDFGTVYGSGTIPIQSVDVTHTTMFTADVVRLGVNYKFWP